MLQGQLNSFPQTLWLQSQRVLLPEAGQNKWVTAMPLPSLAQYLRQFNTVPTL